MFQRQLINIIFNQRRTFVGFNEPPIYVKDPEIGDGKSLDDLRLECCKDYQNPHLWTDKKVEETYAFLVNLDKKIDRILEKID